MNTPQQPEPTQNAPLPETTSIGGFVAGPLQTNCYVLADTSRLTAEGKIPTVVIDPGMGAFTMVQELAEQDGLEVEAVVLTHGHLDHVRAPDVIHSGRRGRRLICKKRRSPYH